MPDFKPATDKHCKTLRRDARQGLPMAASDVLRVFARLDLATQKSEPIDIVIPGDRPTIRPQRVEADDYIHLYPSPAGNYDLAWAKD